MALPKAEMAGVVLAVSLYGLASNGMQLVTLNKQLGNDHRITDSQILDRASGDISGAILSLETNSGAIRMGAAPSLGLPNGNMARVQIEQAATDLHTIPQELLNEQGLRDIETKIPANDAIPTSFSSQLQKERETLAAIKADLDALSQTYKTNSDLQGLKDEKSRVEDELALFGTGASLSSMFLGILGALKIKKRYLAKS